MGTVQRLRAAPLLFLCPLDEHNQTNSGLSALARKQNSKMSHKCVINVLQFRNGTRPRLQTGLPASREPVPFSNGE